MTSVIHCLNIEGGHRYREINEHLSTYIFDSVFRVGGDLDEITCLYVGNIGADLYSALPADNDVGLFRHMVVGLLRGTRFDHDPGYCQFVG